MGCISSKQDINDIHHNIFQVMNVDELGNRLNPGQLEITETDLVLHQRRKAPVKWPLRCLRRYGFDAELFSFESGRRCPTGPGIYAFRCQRAEQLFNLLQTHILVRNNVGDDGISRDFPLPSIPGPTISLRGSSSGDSNYLDPTPMRASNRTTPGTARFTSQNGVLSTRLDSVGSSSNGPLSPQGTASPSPPIPMLNAAVISSVSSSNPSMHYANEELFSTSTSATDTGENNNKEQLRQSLPSSVTISLSNESSAKEKPVSRLSVCSGDGLTVTGLSDPSAAMASYVNIDLSNGPLSPSCSVDDDADFAHVEVLGGDIPVYMNLVPGPENGRPAAPDLPVPLRVRSSLSPSGILPPPSQNWDVEESKRCYANLQRGEVESPFNLAPKNRAGNARLLPFMSSLSPNQSLQLVVSPVNTQRQVNYIVLDLQQNKEAGVNGISSQQPVPQPTTPVGSLSLSVVPLPSESSQRVSEGYATIDFNKTVALSHSVNPNMGNDNEGSRRTRHNSTISDLHTRPVRHSSSE